MEDADASLLVGVGEVRRCKEGIRVEGWIIGRHYCPAPIDPLDTFRAKRKLRKDRSEVVALSFYEQMSRMTDE